MSAPTRRRSTSGGMSDGRAFADFSQLGRVGVDLGGPERDAAALEDGEHLLEVLQLFFCQIGERANEREIIGVAPRRGKVRSKPLSSRSARDRRAPCRSSRRLFRPAGVAPNFEAKHPLGA